MILEAKIIDGLHEVTSLTCSWRPNRGQIIWGHISDRFLEAKIINRWLEVTSPDFSWRPNHGQIIWGHIPDMFLEAKIIDGLLEVKTLTCSWRPNRGQITWGHILDVFLEAKQWTDHLSSHPWRDVFLEANRGQITGDPIPERSSLLRNCDGLQDYVKRLTVEGTHEVTSLTRGQTVEGTWGNIPDKRQGIHEVKSLTRGQTVEGIPEVTSLTRGNIPDKR